MGGVLNLILNDRSEFLSCIGVISSPRRLFAHKAAPALIKRDLVTLMRDYCLDVITSVETGYKPL